MQQTKYMTHYMYIPSYTLLIFFILKPSTCTSFAYICCNCIKKCLHTYIHILKYAVGEIYDWQVIIWFYFLCNLMCFMLFFFAYTHIHTSKYATFYCLLLFFPVVFVWWYKNWKNDTILIDLNYVNSLLLLYV